MRATYKGKVGVNVDGYVAIDGKTHAVIVFDTGHIMTVPLDDIKVIRK